MKSSREQTKMKSMKREQRKIKREQGWTNDREQGAKGENVRGAGNKDPPTEP